MYLREILFHIKYLTNRPWEDPSQGVLDLISEMHLEAEKMIRIRKENEKINNDTCSHCDDMLSQCNPQSETQEQS